MKKIVTELSFFLINSFHISHMIPVAHDLWFALKQLQNFPFFYLQNASGAPTTQADSDELI